MDRRTYPPCVKDVLNAPKDKLPFDRPHQNRPRPEIDAELKNSITTWHTFSGPKHRIEVKLSELAAEIRWRELEAPKERLDEYDVMASIPDGPRPQGSRFTRQVKGNTYGARQLQQHQRVQKPELALRAVNAQIAAMPSQSAAAVCRQGQQSMRQCLGCSKVLEADDAADNLEVDLCSFCRQRQAKALEIPWTSGVALKTFQSAKLRSASGSGGGAAAGLSGAVPRPLSQTSFYRAGPGAVGSSNPSPAPSAVHTAPESLVQAMSAPAQTGRSKREQQQQQQSPANRRKTLDAGDDELPGKRGAGAAKPRGRRSAQVEPEIKEPIDLVDSSDEENKEGAVERAKTHAEAEGGPSSIAGGKGKGGSFLKLSAQLAGLKCWFPQEGGKYSVEVTAEDLARLENGEFLNDTCIDFYIKYIEYHLPEDIRTRYHFFNSFFLKKLQEKPSNKGGKLSKADRLKQDHERVKKWTKHVDLFSKDFIFVPIHGFLHWSLVLICHPGNVAHNDNLHPPVSAEGSTAQGAGGGSPLLLHLDSLAGNHAPKSIFEALRSYMELEWKRKMDDETHDSVPRRWKERFVNAKMETPDVRFTAQTLAGISMSARLPKQDNHTDCGLFVLSYMDFFTAANPRCVVSEGSNAQDVHALDPCTGSANAETLLQKDWFRRCNAARLRDHLRALICKLMLERVSPDDERRNTLACVVSDYGSKPHRMGRRYLQPAEYLSYVEERPNEPEPVFEDDVLSDGSDAERHVEESKEALGSPSRTMTRAAAKKAGMQPMEGLRPATGAENKRRKAHEAAVCSGPSSLAADMSVVDLSSSEKAKSASQAAKQQEPMGLKETGSVPGPMDVDGGEQDSEEADVEVVSRSPRSGMSPGTGLHAERSPASSSAGEDGVDEPAAKRAKRQMDAATNFMAQGQSIALDSPATAMGAQELGESLGKAAALQIPSDAPMEDAEPPKQRPGRRRRAVVPDVHDDAAVGAGMAGATAARCSQMAPSSQQDAETLPASRPPSCASPCSLKSVAATLADEVDAAPGCNDTVGLVGGHGRVPRLSTGKQEDRGLGATGTDSPNLPPADVRAPVAAVGTEPGTGLEGPHRGAVAKASTPSLRPEAAQKTSQIVAPTPDGLVTGDGVDGYISESPSWAREEAAKLCRYPDPNLASRDSDDEPLPQKVSAPQVHDIARPRPQSQRQPQPQQPTGSRTGTAGARTAPGNASPALYRTHIRFADDGEAMTRERVGISADEAGGAPLHRADFTQQYECEPYRTDSFGGAATERAKRRRCSDADASFARSDAAAAQMPVTEAAQTPASVDDELHNGKAATAARDDQVDVVDLAGGANAAPMTSVVGACKSAPTYHTQGSVAHRPVGTALQGHTSPAVLQGRSSSGFSVGVQAAGDGLAPWPGTTKVPAPAELSALGRPISNPPCLVMMQVPAGGTAVVGDVSRETPEVAAPSPRALAFIAPGAQVPPMSARGRGPGARVRDKDVDADIGANLSYPRSTNPDTTPGAAWDKQHSHTRGLEPVGSMQAIRAPRGWHDKCCPLDDNKPQNKDSHQGQQPPEGSRTAQMDQAPLALLRSGQSAAPRQSKDTSPAGMVFQQETSAPHGSVKGGNKIRQKVLQLQQLMCESRERRNIPGLPCLSPPVVGAGNSHASQRPSTEPDKGNVVRHQRSSTGVGEVGLSCKTPYLTDTDPQQVGGCHRHHADKHRLERHSAEQAREVQQYAEQQLWLSSRAEVTRKGAGDATNLMPVLLPALEPVEGVCLNGTQTLSPQSQSSHPILHLDMQEGNGSQEQARRQEVIDGGSLLTDDETGVGSPRCRAITGAGVEHPLVENALALPAPGTTPTNSNQVAPVAPTEHVHLGIPAFNQMLKIWAVGLAEGLTVGTGLLKGKAMEVLTGGQAIRGAASAAAGPSSATWKGVNGAGNQDWKRSDPNAGFEREVSITVEHHGDRNLADDLDVGILSQAARGTEGTTQSSQRKQRSDGNAFNRSQRAADGQVRHLGSEMDRGPSEAATAARVNAAATRPGREVDRKGSKVATQGLATATPPAKSSVNVFVGSAGSGGRTDEQEEETREDEHNGHGNAAAEGTTHRQISAGDRGQPSMSGRGFENEAEEVQDSDEEDSVDIVDVIDQKGKDDSGEDSDDAFVEGKAPGSSRRRTARSKARLAHGKQSKHRGQRRSRGGGDGRGKGRKGGASASKSPSSTKGVNPSRGGGASSSADGRDGKLGCCSTLGSDAQAGRMATFCVRQGAETSGLEVKPDFPRNSQIRTAGPQDNLCDLTQDDD